MRQVPKTNNARHSRTPLSADVILRCSDYPLRVAVLRRFMTEDALRPLLESYCKNRCERVFTPSKKQLKIFDTYTTGKITIEEAAKQLGFVRTYQSYHLIGRLHAYLRDQKRES